MDTNGIWGGAGNSSSVACHKDYGKQNQSSLSPLILFFFMAFFLIKLAHAFPGESITLDPVSGDYTIIYWNESMEPPELETTTFVPSTKIDPRFQSRFQLERDSKIVYRYTLTSGKQSKQTIGLLILDPVHSIIGVKDKRGINMDTEAGRIVFRAISDANEAAVTTPTGWTGKATFFGVELTDNSVRASWRTSQKIVPGGQQQGFGFASYALPGLIAVEVKGRAPVHGWSGEGPTKDSAIYEQLNRVRDNNFVPRPAAVPAIAVPVPFDAAILLERIQTQMHTWIAMQLLDATFSSQVDRYLTAAANAYRLNQPKAGKEHIQTLRKMLKKEHEDADKDDDKEDGKHDEKSDNKNKRLLIDHLAARVLDFDLKYVLKRTGGED